VFLREHIDAFVHGIVTRLSGESASDPAHLVDADTRIEVIGPHHPGAPPSSSSSSSYGKPGGKPPTRDARNGGGSSVAE
jgi:hypothetical protein